MDDFLAMGQAPGGQQIYMSELSSKTLADNGLSEIGGLYLYETDDVPGSSGIRVLASVPCSDAGFRMMDVLGLKFSA